ncbi:MAG: isoprenyl transferase [Alphaproteobacteria bacterium]|nr:isoprenyl transferase [Alphaproteobacteria bacterium]
MDGNGRWADARGMSRAQGHRSGVEAVRRAVQAVMELKIPILTIYSFSSENWSRPQSEINDLMGLMKRFIRRDLADLHKNNVKIVVIGERDGVDPDMMGLIDEACELTTNNDALTLVIAFNYGARSEIARAAHKIARDVSSGDLKMDDITPEALSARLDTGGLPDPDLLIRTSGELRLSNFLLWQAAYAELVFLDVLWPDFSKEHLEDAIVQYNARDRRYGGLSKRSAS